MMVARSSEQKMGGFAVHLQNHYCSNLNSVRNGSDAPAQRIDETMPLSQKLIHLSGQSPLDSPHRTKLLFGRLIGCILAQVTVLLCDPRLTQSVVFLRDSCFELLTQLPGTDGGQDQFFGHGKRCRNAARSAKGIWGAQLALEGARPRAPR